MLAMQLEEIMRQSVVTAEPDASICDVAGELSDMHVGSAVIIENGDPVGIVTDRDIAVRLCANWADARDMTVRDVMTPDPITIDTDATVLEVAEIMAENEIRRLPVVENGDLVGIISQDDVIVLVSNYLDVVADGVKAQAPPEAWGREY